MIQTEQAQYAIANVIKSIREACARLLEKRKELESQIKKGCAGEELDNHIAVINLRLDTLAKVELKLLAPLADEYQQIEQHEPGRLSAMAAQREAGFVESMLQGLNTCD